MSDAPVAVVTGGNRGIGLDVCRQLALLGHVVVLTARDARKAEQAAGWLGVEHHALDVTDDASVAALAAHLTRRHGRVDVLVNNAAIHYDTWQRASSADLGVVREAMETNFYGPWRTVLALLPLLRASRGARVVNVSSEAGSLASMGGGTPAYGTSKAALNALTLKLAAELPAMKVNAVCPGWVATDMGGAGGRPVEQGAASVVWAATLPDDGPTGGFFRDGERVAW
ncbi:SDR family oxidoreductase [Saccharothrix sp. S26]|uniref:SDR family oxidoreductase n=1 Tax=Saccharothrix sp. S26 TaxID=2907215 RepID=UPI001F450429|nr:SDR family oxidoreductase [Saccharothrix sp. S26]MCE6994709.1 SDR family oxidoreductase [Saccharothrix sp. S26]